MASVTFPPSIGGDGSTVTDDSSPTTGLGNGGHRTRFIPSLSQMVAIASYVVAQVTGLLASAGTSATSITSMTVGIGAQAFVLAQTGKAFVIGQWVLIADNAAPATNWMIGQITAFNAGTGAITVQVTATLGSGTKAAWTVSLTATQGVIAGDLTASKRVIFNGSISPAALGASVNDWAPAGIASAGTIKSSGSIAAAHVTGLLAGVDGQEITLINTGATNPLYLDHQSGSSAAANRFILPGGATKRILPGESVVITYEATAARWMLAVGLATAQAADIRTGTTYGGPLTPGDVYDALAYVALADAATVAVDMAAAMDFTLPIGGNRTLGNPTNPKVGETGTIVITQDGTGTRTLAMASNWKRAGGAVALSTAAGAIDIIKYEVITTTYILYDVKKGPS